MNGTGPRLIIFSLAITSTALAQDVPTRYPGPLQTLELLREQVHHLREAQGGDREGDAFKLLEQIGDSYRFLMFRWRQGEDEPDEYALSVAYDLRLLQQVEVEKDRSRREVLLKRVADDLAVKVRDCKDSEEEAGRLIKVKVTTKRKGKEVKDFEVWYVPRGWADVRAAFKRFDKNSSPTERMLAPGEYVMWTREPGAPEGGKAAEGDKKPVEVRGSRQAAAADVDLPAP